MEICDRESRKIGLIAEDLGEVTKLACGFRANWLEFRLGLFKTIDEHQRKYFWDHIATRRNQRSLVLGEIPTQCFKVANSSVPVLCRDSLPLKLVNAPTGSVALPIRSHDERDNEYQ